MRVRDRPTDRKVRGRGVSNNNERQTEKQKRDGSNERERLTYR